MTSRADSWHQSLALQVMIWRAINMASTAAVESVDSRTLFVKGISFASTQQQLEQAFSQIGPVRSCFLIKHSSAQKHKGCGLVQYALPEDAARALQELNGTFIDGRRVQVEQARRRPVLEERLKRKRSRQDETPREDEAPQEGPSKKVKPGLAAEDKQALVRTVAVGGGTGAAEETAKRLAASAGEVEHVAYPAPDALVRSLKLQRDGCPGGPVMLVRYSKNSIRTLRDELTGDEQVKEATHAVSILHAHALPEAQAGKLWARQAAGEGAHLKKWRLIIRNLAFQAQEKELRALLSPAGFLWDVTIPVDEQGKRRGFAFATLTSPADAQRAIKSANGKTHGEALQALAAMSRLHEGGVQVLRGRMLAVDWAVAKSQFQASTDDQAAGGVQAEPDALPHTNDTADAMTQGNIQAGKVAGIPSPSHQKEPGTAEAQQDDAQQEHTASRGEQAMMQSVVGQLVASEAGDTDGSRAEKREGQLLPNGGRKMQAGERSKPGRPLVKEDAPATSKAPPTQPKGELSTTVFVRGLPPDITQNLLHARLAAFGRVGACRLVMHKGTGKPKGTAFVEFADRAGAEAASNATDSARQGGGPAVTVQGTPIEISLALSQEDARNLAQGKAHAGPADNRNLYLAKEGTIEEGSQAWQELSPGDRARRKQGAQEIAAKLRSPNFYVSKTRLSLRSLPKTMDEAALKLLLRDAVLQRAVRAVPHIKQVKILRDPSKPDKAGKPTSRGMGFAEFASHEHALCALRQLNNNPTVFGDARRPIVEFAIENAVTMRRRQDRQDHMKRKALAGPSIENEAAAPKRQKQDQKQAQPHHLPQKPPKQKVGKHLQSKPAKGGRTPTVEQVQEVHTDRNTSMNDHKKKRKSKGGGELQQATADHAEQAGARPRKQPRTGTGLKHPERPKQKGGLSQGQNARISGGDLQQQQSSRAVQKQGPKREIKKAKKGEKQDKFDELAAQYKNRLFGQAATQRPSAQALKRWFE